MSLRIKLSIEIPTKTLDATFVATALAQKQRNITAQEIIQDFEKTVEGWQERPQFTYRSIVNSQRVAIQVFPTGRGKSQYELVSSGSPPHSITSKRPGGFLTFQTGYSSATTAGSLTSRSKRRFGGFMKPYYVNHPGFEAREFPKLIADKNKDKFAADMQDAVNEATKRR